MTRAQTVARLLGTGLDGGQTDATTPITGGSPTTASSDIVQTFDGGTP
jgi:hypothetical protein